MRKIPSIAFLLVSLLIIQSSSAEAAGWSQRWQQSSAEIWNGQQVGPFDEMGIWATDGTGAIFQDPAFSNFSVSGWISYNEAGNISARAFSLAPMTYIQFDMNYATQFGVADFLYMCAYNGEVRERQRVTYDSVTGWSYPEFTGTDAEWHEMGGGDPIPVPEPSTFLLFLAWPILVCYNLRR